MLGRRIGRFAVERALGAGGMGAVYAARDEVLDRLVALKVLPAATESDPERRQRLLREARSAAALSHPNVAIVYEAGEDEGVVFLAMELVDGESLAARLVRGPLSLEDLARLGVGIARGLACAHETGVIHRDLKPANVMVARDGTPKLVDFGLARPPERASPNVSRESFTGVVVGTPGYMAPEQLRGEATDARTDLFALGVVLHELWTGKPPFGQSGLSAMALTLYEEPARLEDVREGAPRVLSDLVARLLQKEPSQRPVSAREVATELETLALGATARQPALALAPPPIGLHGAAATDLVAASASVRVEPRTPSAIAPTIEVVRASRRPVESELSLLGRDEDVAAIESALSSGARLVTITGPPGIGKTALAAHLAARLGARGVRVTSVELGPIATQTELESALVVALRRDGQKGARLADLLALEEGLVFVDGGEAASSELAARVREWLAAAPSVRFVLSRRNVLGLDAETVLALGPLPAVASRELFRDRARRARAGASAWSSEDLAAIDEIATLLEGSPLALSLAASRVALLSPRDIATRLAAGGHEARLALLTDRKGTGSVKSLREAIAWSFALLAEDDARVLVRLSLFEGPFTTQAAERIAHLPGDAGDALGVLDALEGARAASLVRSVHDAEGEVRSVIEPNVRAFARARLAEDPRAREVEEAFVHELGAVAREGVLAPERAGRLVAIEGPSLRAAVRLAQTSSGLVSSGLAIPALWCASLLLAHVPDAEVERALGALLSSRGAAIPGDLQVHAELALYHRQTERDVEGAIARAASIVQKAQFLGDAELLAVSRGVWFDALVRGARLELARDVAVAMLEAAHASGNAGHEIDAYEKLGVIAWRRSQPEDAFGALGRALALAESLRDRRRQAHVLMSLGIQCVQTRRFLEARSFYERSRELARAEHLVRVVATLANNLGVVHHEEDRLEEARASFEEAAEQGTRAGMALLVGVARGNAGMVDHECGRLLEARLALDTAVRLLASLGDTRFRAVFLGARAALHADDGAIELARADLAAAGALLERAFEPQLALALSIRSAHVELAEASLRGDAASRARARTAAEAHLGESTVATSVAARSDLARMALRALVAGMGARRRHGDGPP